MRSWAILLIGGYTLMGCRDTATDRVEDPPSLADTAMAPSFTRTANATASSMPAIASAATPPEAGGAGGSAAPSLSAAALASASAAPAGSADAPDDDAAKVAAAAALVEVRNVGMHIGGEANTNEQKRPIRAAVRKYYNDMRVCYGKAPAPKVATTFGVDMRIEGKGGPPKVTNPRSGFKHKVVRACLLEVFESIAFPRQPHGVDRMVSFSVEFRNKRRPAR